MPPLLERPEEDEDEDDEADEEDEEEAEEEDGGSDNVMSEAELTQDTAGGSAAVAVTPRAAIWRRAASPPG
eukprot:3471835-Ditylum_brightwellii.AAC.1